MHSLYWRIFLAFWAALALILVGTVTVAVNATAHRSDRPWIQRSQLFAQAARAFESGGPAALQGWLQSLPTDPFGRTFIIGPEGREMLGRPLPHSLSAPSNTNLAAGASVGALGGAIAPIGGALVLVAPDGATYHVVVGPVRDSPRLFGELELPGLAIVDAVLAESLAEAVRYAAMDLAVHDQRIDRAPDIVDSRVAHDFDEPGSGIDLNLADMAAVREAREIHGLVAFARERAAQLVRQIVALQSLSGDLEDSERTVGSLDPEAAILEFEIGGSCFQCMARDLQAFGDDIARGVEHDDTGEAQCAA